jgi:hypothetical protein
MPVRIFFFSNDTSKEKHIISVKMEVRSIKQLWVKSSFKYEGGGRVKTSLKGEKETDC